ncbi:MAG: D-alanine--D-alanine ligase [Elusimicrobia bacterium]|nr:D-alanine--D-alanine ligase [Elusimicrobiota bacterium]
MNVKNLKSKRIGVLYGGWSAEREISLKSGEAVINALKKGGYKAVPIDVDRNFATKLPGFKIDIAFIILHGPFGEDGTIQAVLQTAGIPYTGCGVLSSALAMNKIFSKEIFDFNKILTPEWTVISKTQTKDNNLRVESLGYPLVVKPATQGSAIGVTIAKNNAEFKKGLRLALKFDDQILVEEYIPGKELTVGILGNKVLPVVEIVPIKGKFYDFKAKYAKGGSKHIVPAKLDKETTKLVQAAAKKAFDAVGCKAVARIDFRLTPDNKPYILEINTLPGLTQTSLLPDAAKAAGFSFLEMVLEIIKGSL